MPKEHSDAEQLYLQMITAANSARTEYLKAVQFIKEKRVDDAMQQIDSADKHFADARKVHLGLLQAEAVGELSGVDLYLLHAEDIMMSAETYKIFTIEIVNLYTVLAKNNLQI